MERASLQAAKTTLPALAALGLLWGCDPPRAQPVHPAVSAAATQDYRAAPELLGGGAGSDGRTELSGSAAPGAVVRLASPGGAALFATADAGGVWRMVVPSSNAPRLLGLSMSSGGQVVQAVGYIFMAPDGTVARLRVGGGTQAPPASAAALAPLALDYDNQRAATLSGLATPQETVSVRVDGVERGQAVTDAKRRFVIQLSQPLAVGPHAFDLVGVGGDADVSFSITIDAPAPLANATYAASRFGAGWRVDWITPGGGEQTTLILGPSEPGA